MLTITMVTILSLVTQHMVFQPVLVVVLLEIAILEVGFIGYEAYREYTRTWDTLLLSIAVGSIFVAGSLAATMTVMGDIVTTRWNVIIGGALSLVLGLGLVANALYGQDVALSVPRTRDGPAGGR